MNHDTAIEIPGDRCEQIADLYRACARQLERRVARNVRADPQMIEDACSHAWLQLLTHPAVEIRPPWYRPIGWLTQAATWEVYRLTAKRTRDAPLDPSTIATERHLRGPVGPGADELAAQRARLDLVDEVPERPRRFLLRLALGYSYRDIAADEHASLTTTNKQIARAKRQLRALDAAEVRQPGRPPAAAAVTDDRRLAA